jgi:DNA repair protein RecN (Recombination protein N)
VMLALKSTLAARDAIPTLVFDEIDAGLSGETARRVGHLMEKLAESHQVLCITHHAPIAARAALQASVRKTLRHGATFTDIVPVEGQERLEELARMMGGDAGAEAARELARQLMA